MLNRVVTTSSILGSLLMAQSVSAADGLPRYDVMALCTQVKNQAGPYGVALYNECIDDEQSAYDALRSHNGGVSKQVVTKCDQQQIPGLQSYQALQRCVDLSNASQQPLKEFEY